MARVIPIGLPENDSERKAIAYLKKYLPADYVLIHNFEISNKNGFPYEYDIVIIGDFAVYMVEVKGYRGTITGNAKEWRLASDFTTKSPIPLANKKAKILGSKLSQDFRFQDVWVQALIVLSDDKVKIKLNDDQARKSVLHLKDAVEYMMSSRHLPVRAKNITSLREHIVSTITTQFQPLHRKHEIGDFTILETIGKNQLYTSFLARHKILKTKEYFLLKVYDFNIYATYKEQIRQRNLIQRDAEALARLGVHPNIAQSLPPFHWEDNRLVLPIKWSQGISLSSIWEQDISLSYSDRLSIAQQIGRGLHYAHQNGVIHRNLHSSNVIMQENTLNIKLVGFDYSQILDEDMQTIATRFGRALDENYCAPELFENVHNASEQSDIYAWGIVLFKLFCRELPYHGISSVYTHKGLTRKPTDVNPNLPHELDEIISQMCAFSPEERYASVVDVLDDLEIIK